MSLTITVPPGGIPENARPSAVDAVPIGKFTSKICRGLVLSPMKVTVDPAFVTVPVVPVLSIGSLMHWEMAMS